VSLLASVALAQEQPEAAKQAVAAITKLGGQVKRDPKAPGRPVVEVEFGGTGIRDKHLPDLNALPSLRRLGLSFTGVTEKGLEKLKACRQLERLDLFCCPRVTDKGVEQLKALTGLRELDLSHTAVTERGLEHLHGLTGLQRLGLQGIRLGKEEEQRLRRALPQVKIDQGNGNTAQKRVRQHFAIPEDKPLTAEVIRSAALAKVPVGSAEEQLYSRLKANGVKTASEVGKADHSYYYPADEEGKVVCRIDLDPGSGEIVHTHYCLVFQLDDGKKLKDVEVKVWFTGP
jgi:hypothetical protein